MKKWARLLCVPEILSFLDFGVSALGGEWGSCHAVLYFQCRHEARVIDLPAQTGPRILITATSRAATKLLEMQIYNVSQHEQ